MLLGLQRALRLTAGFEVLQFAAENWKAQTALRMEDAYKWLFHAMLGGEHALTNTDAATAWLDKEWQSLASPREGEPAAASLKRDGTIVRFNLRPFKANGGDKDRLMKGFVASAKSFKPDKVGFVEVWRMLGLRLQAASMGELNHEDWRELDELTKEKGYPAIDHSPEYISAYAPAYRVLTAKQATLLKD